MGRPRTHNGPVFAVAFSHDGRQILTGCGDGSVTRWEVPTPMEGSAEEVQEWASSVTGLKLDDDGIARPLDIRGTR